MNASCFECESRRRVQSHRILRGRAAFPANSVHRQPELPCVHLRREHIAGESLALARFCPTHNLRLFYMKSHPQLLIVSTIQSEKDREHSESVTTSQPNAAVVNARAPSEATS